MCTRKAKSGAGTLLVLAGIAAHQAVAADVVQLDPGTFPAVAQVDARFQSYNVEMAEVIGAKFWKPYAHMSTGGAPPTDVDVGRDPNLFEARAPADLRNPRLRVMAAALGPAYVRVSGTWANSVYFQNDDAPALVKPPDGYGGVLTRSQWKGVVDFAKAVDARIVTSFTISSGVRDASGTWTPVEAKPLLEFTRSIGGQIFAAELFNEPNLSSHGGGPKSYDAPAFARDSAAFRTFVTQVAPDMRIAGPGDVMTANATIDGAPTSQDLMTAEPVPRFDIFSYHFYPAVSQRCAPSTNKKVGTSQKDALTEAWLARTDQTFQAHKAVRDRYAAGAPIWITETAQAACGGSPWAATFIDTFRYLDQMGRLAKQGASVVFHNTLAASEYGLIDQTNLQPRPNYWAALLWRRLMGAVVLDAGPTRSGLRVYAHCLRDRPGGVSVLAINTSDAPAVLRLPAPTDVYALSAPSLKSSSVLLNGRPLTMGPDDRIPELHAQPSKTARVTLAPKGIDFIAVPAAQNADCH